MRRPERRRGIGAWAVIHGKVQIETERQPRKRFIFIHLIQAFKPSAVNPWGPTWGQTAPPSGFVDTHQVLLGDGFWRWNAYCPAARTHDRGRPADDVTLSALGNDISVRPVNIVLRTHAVDVTSRALASSLASSSEALSTTPGAAPQRRCSRRARDSQILIVVKRASKKSGQAGTNKQSCTNPRTGRRRRRKRK